jgi:hypothetical protein
MDPRLVLVVLAGIAVVAVLVASGRRRTTNPVKPPKPPVTPSTTVPFVMHDILGLMLDPPNGGWAEGNLVRFGVTPEVHGCKPNEILNGYEENGSGPMECRVQATVVETGGVQCIYNKAGDAYCNGEWLPANRNHEPTEGAFYMRLGMQRAWKRLQIGGNCHPTYIDVPLGPAPKLPEDKDFTIHFEIEVRNASGWTEKREYTRKIAHKVCGVDTDAGNATPDPDGCGACK